MEEARDAYAPETWFNRERARRCVEALKASGFQARFAETKEAAAEAVLAEVPEGASVGFGGSVTLRELGLPGLLKDSGHRTFDHWDPSLSPEEKTAARDAQATADVFLTSVNALTEDGALVSVDGSGNRVGSTVFGPKASVVVCGYNKIVANIPEALERVRKYAAPINYKRLNMDVPCQKGEGCEKCQPRQCRVTTIIEAPPGAKKRFVVIVVGEKLGF